MKNLDQINHSDFLAASYDVPRHFEHDKAVVGNMAVF